MTFKRQPKKMLTICLFALLTAVGCATKYEQATEKRHAEEAQGKAVTKAASKDAEASKYTEIQFNFGSSMLTEKSKDSLSNLMKNSNNAEIDEVIVLSWSDVEYPSKSADKLSKLQLDLANRRNENVEAYVKALRNVEINTYNMAEKPNTLSRLLDTNDSKLKNSFLSAGLTTTTDKSTYANKATHSVILVKLK